MIAVKTYPSSASEICEDGLFTDDFFLNPAVNHRNDHVWSASKNKDVDKSRLVKWRNMPSTSWSLLVSAMAEKEDCISLQTSEK